MLVFCLRLVVSIFFPPSSVPPETKRFRNWICFRPRETGWRGTTESVLRDTRPLVMLGNCKTMDKVQMRSGRASPEPFRAGMLVVAVLIQQLKVLETLPLDFSQRRQELGFLSP